MSRTATPGPSTAHPVQRTFIRRESVVKATYYPDGTEIDGVVVPKETYIVETTGVMGHFGTVETRRELVPRVHFEGRWMPIEDVRGPSLS